MLSFLYKNYLNIKAGFYIDFYLKLFFYKIFINWLATINLFLFNIFAIESLFFQLRLFGRLLFQIFGFFFSLDIRFSIKFVNLVIYYLIFIFLIFIF